MPGGAIDGQLLRLSANGQDRAGGASLECPENQLVRSWHHAPHHELALAAKSACEILELSLLDHEREVSFPVSQHILKWLGFSAFTHEAFPPPAGDALKTVSDHPEAPHYLLDKADSLSLCHR